MAANATKMGKAKVRYDTGRAPEATRQGSPDETVVFLSKQKNLTIIAYRLDKDDNGRPYYEPVPAVFSGGEFRTSDQDMVDALRKHDNFGGSNKEDYVDAGRMAPLYWEGGYPRWYMEAEDMRRKDLTQDEGKYEPGG